MRERSKGHGEGRCGSDGPGWNRLVLHCPELTLKGRNQPDFRRRLQRNLARRLGALGRHWRVVAAHGRAYVDCEGAAPALIEQAAAAAREVAGVADAAKAIRFEPLSVGLPGGALDWAALEPAALRLARHAAPSRDGFAVRAKRADKRLGIRSRAIEARLGDLLRRDGCLGPVNLDAPGVVLHVDIYPDGLYLYTDRLPGVGGLPVGSGGRVLALLSTGIDSPVAAWMLARRGCSIDFLHLAAAHPRREGLEDELVVRLARHLSRYTLRSRLFIVPYTYFDLALPPGDPSVAMILFRRFMLRLAACQAARTGALALAVGDSVGQVASQTLENIASATKATDMPVLHPLIGCNKLEIIDRARAIGTYEMSIEPAKDCCALLSERPRTRTRPAHLQALEAAAFSDYDAMLQRSLADSLGVRLECGGIAEMLDNRGDSTCVA